MPSFQRKYYMDKTYFVDIPIRSIKLEFYFLVENERDLNNLNLWVFSTYLKQYLHNPHCSKLLAGYLFICSTWYFTSLFITVSSLIVSFCLHMCRKSSLTKFHLKLNRFSRCIYLFDTNNITLYKIGKNSKSIQVPYKYIYNFVNDNSTCCTIWQCIEYINFKNNTVLKYA